MSKLKSVRNALLKFTTTAPALCPRCGSPNFITFEKERFCQYCPWDSIEANSDTHESLRPLSRTYEDTSSYGQENLAVDSARDLLFESGFSHLNCAFV